MQFLKKWFKENTWKTSEKDRWKLGTKLFYGTSHALCHWSPKGSCPTSRWTSSQQLPWELFAKSMDTPLCPQKSKTSQWRAFRKPLKHEEYLEGYHQKHFCHSNCIHHHPSNFLKTICSQKTSVQHLWCQLQWAMCPCSLHHKLYDAARGLRAASRGLAASESSSKVEQITSWQIWRSRMCRMSG